MQKQNDETGIESTRVIRRGSSVGEVGTVASELDSLDEEAEELYQWTQGLSVDPSSTSRYSNSLMSGHWRDMLCRVFCYWKSADLTEHCINYSCSWQLRWWRHVRDHVTQLCFFKWISWGNLLILIHINWLKASDYLRNYCTVFGMVFWWCKFLINSPRHKFSPPSSLCSLLDPSKIFANPRIRPFLKTKFRLPRLPGGYKPITHSHWHKLEWKSGDQTT